MFRVFPSGSVVKNPPAMQEMQETQVQSSGQADPLEKSMATHSSMHAWKIPQTEEPEGYSPRGRKEWNTTEATEHAHTQEHSEEHTHSLVVLVQWWDSSDYRMNVINMHTPVGGD